MDARDPIDGGDAAQARRRRGRVARRAWLALFVINPIVWWCWLTLGSMASPLFYVFLAIGGAQTWLGARAARASIGGSLIDLLLSLLAIVVAVAVTLVLAYAGIMGQALGGA